MKNEENPLVTFALFAYNQEKYIRGYLSFPHEAGWGCATADQFVAGIEQARAVICDGLYPALRQMSVDIYPLEAARNRRREILQ